MLETWVETTGGKTNGWKEKKGRIEVVPNQDVS